MFHYTLGEATRSAGFNELMALTRQTRYLITIIRYLMMLLLTEYILSSFDKSMLEISFGGILLYYFYNGSSVYSLFIPFCTFLCKPYKNYLKNLLLS